MPNILLPRSISLDSSLLAKVASEWERGAESAKALVAKIASSETRLLLTLHHVVELLAHESDQIADSRTRFVSQLGQVFWIGASELNGLGDCLDLVSAEMKAWIRLGDVSFGRIVAEAREEVIKFGESTNVAEVMKRHEVRLEARARAKRTRITQSLIHAKALPALALSVPVDTRNERISLGALLKRFDDLESALRDELSLTGDRRLENSAAAAAEFYDELRASARKVSNDGQVCLADLLADMGVPENELGRQRSANSLGQSEVWRRKRAIIARRAGIAKQQVNDLKEDALPSLALMQEIASRQDRATRAEGGNFFDSALACLSLYADVTSVDKRTYEYIRQARASNKKLDSVLRTVTRWSDTKHILEALGISMGAWSGGQA